MEEVGRMNDDQPSQVLNNEKGSALRAFIEKNRDNIAKLGNAKEKLRFVIVGEEEKTENLEQGYYQKMVSLLVDELNLPLVEVKQEEMNNVVAELKEGTVEFAFGFPKMENKLISIPATKEETLVLATKRNDITLEEVPYYYWGTEEYYQDFLKDSILEDRTVLFNCKEDLWEAYQLDEIAGMLLKFSTYQNYVKEGEELYLISEMNFPIEEYILISESEEAYETFFQAFLPFYEEYCMENETVPLSTTTEALPMQANNSNLFFLGGFLCLGVIMFISILCTSIHLWRKRKQKTIAQRLYQELVGQEKEENEVLVIDLIGGMAWSNQGFASFLGSERRRKHRKLKELSSRIGFDFEEHYRYIIRQFDRTYQFEYQLYLDGICYRMLEKGIFEQGILVLLITREKLKNKDGDMEKLYDL